MTRHLQSKENRSVSIYIIDDDETLLKLYKKILQKIFLEKCVVKTFLDRKSFLHSLPTCAYSNCFIICDVVLPDGNGFQLKDNLQQKNVNIPVLYITGLGNIKDSAKAGYNVLGKPINRDSLINGIKSITDFIEC